MQREEIIETLHREGCSCVISNGDRVVLCHRRGVRDLAELLESDPGLLDGAFIADKVVGKGAAALMVAGRVSALHADVISEPALRLLRIADVPVTYGRSVPSIINRAGTDICPVEKLCADTDDPLTCVRMIREFLNQKSQ